MVASMVELEEYVPFYRLIEYGFPWCRVHVNRLIAQGRFPAPVKLSPNRIGWRKSDLLALQQTLPLARSMPESAAPPLLDTNRPRKRR